MGAIVGLVIALVVVMGRIFCGVGCHETSKGEELRYELDYAILF